jgi:glycosyltransferase involved in cell wall biosynthesis
MYLCYVDRIGAHSIWRLMNLIAEEVIRRQGRVAYLRWDDGQQLEPLDTPAGVEVHDIAVTPKRYPWDVIKQQREFCEGFATWWERARPDIVHTNFCLPGSSIRRLAKRRFGVATVSTCHEMYNSMNVYLRAQVRRTEQFADRVVYISQTVARSYGATLDQQNRSLDQGHSIIYNGLDTQSIYTIAQTVEARAAHVMVSVGRLVPEKGHDQVIHVMPRLLNDFPDLRYRLIGDGPERERLEALANRLGIGSRVEFLGWLPYERTIQQVARAGMVALPSRHEGFGLALIEAICCGTDVVASNISAFAEVTGTDFDSVTLYQIGDRDDLAEQLRTALSRSPTDVDDRRKSFALVKDRFSALRMVHQYLDLYTELVNPT